MLAEILQQYTYQIGPWNHTNSIIVPMNIWNDMNFQFSLAFYGAAGLGVVLLIFAFVVFLTPASNMISARLNGGRALIAFRRDGTFQIKSMKYKGGFLHAKDGIHQVLPGAMHYSKGINLGACWEDTGTAMPIEQAAAMGMLAKLGIPDAETLELFNFWIKDTNQFRWILADEERQSFELLPSADKSGTFRGLMDHAKEVYAVTDPEVVIKRFEETRKKVPKIEDADEAKKFKAWRLPYWYNMTRGLVTNMMGSMLSWNEIKNFQIYHQNPGQLANMVEAESDRKSRKAPKQNAMLIIVAGVVIMVAVSGMVIAMKMMGVF